MKVTLAVLALTIAPLGLPLSLGGQEFLDPLLPVGRLRVEIKSLFPAPGRQRKVDAAPPTGPEKALSRHTAATWLLRAEYLAGLAKLERGTFHPYRRLWATERKALPDVDVAHAAGWKDTRAMKLSYQKADPATVLAAVQYGT